jgi:hypothetical protein
MPAMDAFHADAFHADAHQHHAASAGDTIRDQLPSQDDSPERSHSPNLDAPYLDNLGYEEPYGTPELDMEYKTHFERLREEQAVNRESVFGVFEDEEHWELTEWLVESGLSGEMIERMLKLKLVSHSRVLDPPNAANRVAHQLDKRLQPSFSSKYKIFKKLDRVRGPQWYKMDVPIQGTKKDKKGRLRTKTATLYFCDIVECIKELVRNPAFRDHLCYAYRTVYLVDEAGVCRRGYSELWSANWMKEVEVRERLL